MAEMAEMSQVNIAQRKSTPKDEEIGVIEITPDSTPGSDGVEKQKMDLNPDVDLQPFWHRWTGKGRRKIGWAESARNIALSSCLNIFLVFIPLSWVAHFQKDWNHSTKFSLAFLAIVPLVRLLEYGGQQIAMYCGKDLGDFLVISLNNAVEATLAITLLTRCKIKLLKSTVVGVVLLHLLLVPGTAFMIGGARIWEQSLHPYSTELNHSLLTIGVMSLLVPAAFFAAIDQGGPSGVTSPLSASTQLQFLQMSRGIGIMLLLVYIGSRIFLLNPPGDNEIPKEALPHAIKHEELRLKAREPEVNSWACLLMLIITVAIMAPTVEWLVESAEGVRKHETVTEEWFGLILLPFVSFSADGALAIVYFGSSCLRPFFGKPVHPPDVIAQGKAIDLSIQFMLFWMPIIVLLGWWTNRPVSLLFDLFEVALLVGACFLVNYVTADSKTNWAEGLILVSFYLMIVLCAWFYPGETSLSGLFLCIAKAEGS